MKNFTKTSLISVVATSALAFIGATGQANAAESPTKIVNYSDINLESAAGAKVLYMRVRDAAEAVCRSHQGRSVREISEYNACFDQAVGAAVASINNPGLTALYSPKHPTTTVRLATK